MSVQKKNIIFLMTALIAVVPVLSQVNYASLKVTSFTSHDKRLAKNLPEYPTLIKPATQSFYSTSAVLFTLSPVKNENTGKVRKEKSYFHIRRAKKMVVAPAKVEITTSNNETTSKEREISFKPTSFTYPENAKTDIGIAQFSEAELILYAKVLKQYAKKNGYDTSYAFFSNMGMLCNKKRFFVVNLVTMEIEQSGLVSHGRGQGPSVFDKQYSNQTGSKCTSLGRYKILGKYRGAYGESYRMVGLDSSNQNALNRNIVLHSMTSIPDTDGLIPACVSDGCPAVSTNFLAYLRKMIDSRKKPVLLWIFDSNLEEALVEEPSFKNDVPSHDPDTNEYHACSLHCRDKLQTPQLP